MAVSIILHEQNQQNAKHILNDSSSLINDVILKKRLVLLATSRQIAQTKNVFGMMIYLVRNRSKFDILLMKYMYRYLTETILNISKTAKVSETVIYDMQGNPISFVKINQSIIEAGYIHSYPNLIGEAITFVDGMGFSENQWKSNEFPRENLFDYQGLIPKTEQTKIKLIDSVLSFVTLIPIIGQTYDPKTGAMVDEQLGFLKSTQKLDQQLINKVARITGVNITLITNPRQIRNILLQNDELQSEGFKERPGIPFLKHLFHTSNSFLNLKDDHQGIIPIYSGNAPLALIINTYSKTKENQQTIRIIQLLSFVFFICIIIIVPLAIFFANSIANPVSHVVEGLKSIADGTIYPSGIPVKTEDEIGELVKGFNLFSSKIISTQNQLRQLSNSILENQEKERAAIARGLHDELGQMLTALKINSVWIWEHLKAIDIAASNRALEMRDLIDKSIDEVRHIALRLRPRILDDLGLIATIEWFVVDFEKRCGIKCEFEGAISENVDNNTAIGIYRIVQEALTNVGRHSKATKSRVALNARPNMIYLVISDNGQGFDPEIRTGSVSTGLGISGIRERMMLLGGEMDIDSEMGKGTFLYCAIPVFKKKNSIGDNEQ